MNNKQIIKDFSARLWDNRDLTAIDDYFTDNTIIQSPLRSTEGKDSMKEIVLTWFEGFPDLTVAWQDLVCDNNTVVSHWTAKGSHQGRFGGIAATKKPIHYQGITTYVLEHGKIKHYSALVDLHGLFKQLND